MNNKYKNIIRLSSYAFAHKAVFFESIICGIALTILFLYQNTEEKSCMEKQKKIWWK